MQGYDAFTPDNVELAAGKDIRLNHEPKFFPMEIDSQWETENVLIRIILHHVCEQFYHTIFLLFFCNSLKNSSPVISNPCSSRRNVLKSISPPASYLLICDLEILISYANLSRVVRSSLIALSSLPASDKSFCISASGNSLAINCWPLFAFFITRINTKPTCCTTPRISTAVKGPFINVLTMIHFLAKFSNLSLSAV